MNRNFNFNSCYEGLSRENTPNIDKNWFFTNYNMDVLIIGFIDLDKAVKRKEKKKII